MMSHTRQLCRAIKVRHMITLLAIITLVTLADYLVTSTRSDISVVVHSYLSSFALLKHVTKTDTAPQDHQHLSSGATVSPNVVPGQKTVGNVVGNVAAINDSTFSQSSIGDQKFLDQMLAGHWSLRNYTTQELEDIETFINRSRAYLKLPTSLQRSDKTCGNVNFPGHQWYRAVCNPKGATPCCMNSSCVDKTVQGCRCPQCYDMRQQIHAELATWVPDSLTMSHFTDETDVCPLLRNKTIYFIGDSYVRQLYTALLAMLRDKNPRHVLKEDLSEADAAKCDKYYRYFADCRYNIIFNTDECNATVKLKMDMSQKISQAGTIFRLVKELRGKHNSWVLLGIGFHDHLDFESLRNRVLNPLITLVSNSSWPKVIWLPIHSPGLLKTPLVETQTARAILAFNAMVKAHLDAQPITLLDFTELTNGTMSYDGSHYGRGVNEVKIQVLLNYFKHIQ